MIVDELLYQAPPADTARLAAQQERERAARNAAGAEAWEAQTFGPAMRAWRRWPCPLTATEIHAYNVMLSVAQIGIDGALSRGRS